jgi:16S rRNA (uracil1498-N3)-methyltransferase
MPRFFTKSITDDHAVIENGDARHIAKSLRMRAGDAITLCDGEGFDYHGEIALIEHERVEVRIHDKKPSPGEPGVKLTLYQALPKSDKLDFIVQKAVELGVREIVPVLSSRCISRPNEQSMAKKTERLNRTALEAAKQCGRGIIPQVAPLMEFSTAIESMRHHALPILCYEDADTALRTILHSQAAEIALMIGSEGGFSPEEVHLAKESGVHIASLGRRILRCETAPICALSAILYACGEL